MQTGALKPEKLDYSGLCLFVKLSHLYIKTDIASGCYIISGYLRRHFESWIANSKKIQIWAKERSQVWFINIVPNHCQMVYNLYSKQSPNFSLKEELLHIIYKTLSGKTNPRKSNKHPIRDACTVKAVVELQCRGTEM